MLEKLLKEIRSGGTVQPTVLAYRLNTSVAMVLAMLESLERLGLLRQIQSSCEDASCGGCPLANSCVPQGRLWVLQQDLQ